MIERRGELETLTRIVLSLSLSLSPSLSFSLGRVEQAFGETETVQYIVIFCQRD